jgi:LacI family transcriptional regulator
MAADETSPQQNLRGRPATVGDVAKLAGVAKATAARALGGYGAVSPAVLQRVEVAAQALDYRPNELARSMTTGRSNTLGVVVGDIENPYFGLAVRGITDAARRHGYHILLSNASENVEFERDAVRVMLDRQVDGLLVAAAASTEIAHLQTVTELGRPLVLLDRRIPALAVDTVSVDNYAAAGQATRSLLAAGHRRIAFLSATVPTSGSSGDGPVIRISTVTDRIDGFLAELTAAGISDGRQFIRLGAIDGAAAAITRELMALPQPPTAIFTSDSLIALQVVRTLRGLSLAIPSDVSLVTFDDSDWTSIVTPPMTVVSQPIYDIGVEATELLIERIEGAGGVGRDRVFPATLIERSSVAAPAR